MLLPPFWRGRGKHAPARIRIARFQAIVKAAQAVAGYNAILQDANLCTPALVDRIQDVEAALSAITPIPHHQYASLFSTRRPARRRPPDGPETRSALLVEYAEARAGLGTCRSAAVDDSDPYSPQSTANFTADLFRLSRALQSPPPTELPCDQAVVVFSGMEAGILTEEQRDDLWNRFQTPLFEQFVGTDGRIVAAECEVHDGMHIRLDDAIVESHCGEIVLTSLTDREAPALRVLSGLSGEIEHAPCECGRAEPRLMRVGQAAGSKTVTAVA